MSESARDPIEVWLVPLARAAAELSDRLQTLSEEERRRAARFRGDRQRADWVMVRSTLRSLIAARLGRSAADVPLEVRPGGKPALAGETSLHFSVSHTPGLALIALAEGSEVGVDVEAWRPPAPHVVARVLAAVERERMDRGEGGAANAVASFYDHWSLKEAYLKCTGQGLAGEPRAVVVTPRTPNRIGGIVVRSLDVGHGYSAALAVQCAEGDEPPGIAIRMIGGYSLAALSL